MQGYVCVNSVYIYLIQDLHEEHENNSNEATVDKDRAKTLSKKIEEEN